MRLLLLLLILTSSALAALQFSEFTRLQDPALIKQLQAQLQDDYREASANQFNQSLERDSLGTILNRAADIFTTNITLVSTSKSRGLKLNPGPLQIVIHARFLVEKSSQEAISAERYMKFSQLADKSWAYRGDTSMQEYYKNFLTID